MNEDNAFEGAFQEGPGSLEDFNGQGQGGSQGQAAQVGEGDGQAAGDKANGDAGGKADAGGNKADGKAASGDKGGAAGKKDAGGAAGTPDKPAGFDRAAWDEFVKGVDPGLGLDSQALQGFGELSEKLGLSAAKAGDMLNFAVEEGKRYQARMREATEKELRQEWGRDFDSKISGARALIERVDRELGEQAGFAKIIEASGLGNNPQFVRGMIMLSSLLSEDSLGMASGSGWAGREETPYEGLKHFFK